MPYFHIDLRADSVELFADIGANLTDPMFQGVYNGSAKHQADLNNVLERGWSAGLQKVIITCGTIFDCEQAFQISNTHGR